MRPMRLVAVVGVGVGLLAAGGNAFAVGSWSWGPGDPSYNPSATVYDGTVDVSQVAMGDFKGVSSSQSGASGYGSSGAEVGWDDTWLGSVGDANGNGDQLDGLWAQIYSDGGWWDLGAASNSVYVFTSQDHGPYLGEGLEYWVYGTNSLWDSEGAELATISSVWLDGWQTGVGVDANGNGWMSDDVSAAFAFASGKSYRYVRLVAWTTEGGYSEPEIDAVGRGAPVPEPGTLLLLGSGLGTLVGVARRRRRE